jgi:hypothetical protein
MWKKRVLSFFPPEQKEILKKKRPRANVKSINWKLLFFYINPEQCKA